MELPGHSLNQYVSTGVLERGEPSSLSISAPVSQMKALSSPSFALQVGRTEDICNNQNDQCSGRRCNHKGTGTTERSYKEKGKVLTCL